MKDSKSNLFLYITYKYFFGFMVVVMIFATIEEFVQGELILETIDIEGLIAFVILLALQLIAHLLFFRATITKQEIKLNGKIIQWDNVKSINRLLNIYILKTKDKKRFYLFPTEKQSIPLIGQRIEYTNMDQIINLKTTA